MHTDQWWSLSMHSALSEIQCYIHTYYLQGVFFVCFFRRLNLLLSLSGPCMMYRMLCHVLAEHGIRFRQWGIECSAKVLALWISTLAIQHHACPITDHALVFWGLSPSTYSMVYTFKLTYFHIFPIWRGFTEESLCIEKSQSLSISTYHTLYLAMEQPHITFLASYSMALLHWLWLMQQSQACAAFQTRSSTWVILLVFTSQA